MEVEEPPEPSLPFGTEDPLEDEVYEELLPD